MRIIVGITIFFHTWYTEADRQIEHISLYPPSLSAVWELVNDRARDVRVCVCVRVRVCVCVCCRALRVTQLYTVLRSLVKLPLCVCYWR